MARVLHAVHPSTCCLKGLLHRAARADALGGGSAQICISPRAYEHKAETPPRCSGKNCGLRDEWVELLPQNQSAHEVRRCFNEWGIRERAHYILIGTHDGSLIGRGVPNELQADLPDQRVSAAPCAQFGNSPWASFWLSF